MTKNKTHKIGIGITTHNRYDVFSVAYAEIKRLMPKGAKLVVVDDASKKPVQEATFRFDENVGIAKAKNKCFELLEDCENIFIFDDDTYPRMTGWYLPYIHSDEPHLMYIFKTVKGLNMNDTRLIYSDNQIDAYDHARGCMLYFKNICLKVAGGMDIEYSRWGYEHGDLSNRIYNLGLTKFRFMDVKNSADLIYSGDEEYKVQTTVSFEERQVYLQNMRAKFNASFSSREFKPYKNYSNAKKRNVILACFFTSQVDTQRGIKWQADYSKLDALIASANKHKIELVILNDCFVREDTEFVKHVFVDQGLNPYFQRWLTQWDYLRNNPDIGRVFCVDATDVEILKNPFDAMNDVNLFIGDEAQIVGCEWIKRVCQHEELLDELLQYSENVLVNCGVVGGSREIVMSLCRDMYDRYTWQYPQETVDMPLFNLLAYTKYSGIVQFGRGVTSLFKEYEANPPHAWFKHK